MTPGTGISRPFHRLSVTLLLLIVLPLGIAAGSDAADLRGRVEWIHDGDTIEVAGIGQVRLIGIDTPERKDGERDRFFVKLGGNGKILRRIAEEALKFNIRQVKGKEVRLEVDHEPRDTYGRLLAYVTLPDGRLLNRILLEKGYAVVYRRFDFRLKEDFLEAEAGARFGKVGLWAR
jgi:micrococcal nuclease